MKKRIRTVDKFIGFVESGPSALSAESVDKLKFYIPSSKRFLCQPALCVYAALTFTNGPSLVFLAGRLVT